MRGGLKGWILCLLLPLQAFAASFVLDNDGNLLVSKSVAFVQALSTEIRYKSGFSLYVDVLNRPGQDTREERKLYEKSVLEKLPRPYAVIFFYRPSKKINVVLSEDAKDVFDVDKIFFDYIAPLLPEKDDDLTPQRISGIILNGYSEIADRIADKYGITLENNFPSQNQSMFVRVVLYLMLMVLVGLFAIAYFFKRDKK